MRVNATGSQTGGGHAISDQLRLATTGSSADLVGKLRVVDEDERSTSASGSEHDGANSEQQQSGSDSEPSSPKSPADKATQCQCPESAPLLTRFFMLLRCARRAPQSKRVAVPARPKHAEAAVVPASRSHTPRRPSAQRARVPNTAVAAKAPHLPTASLHASAPRSPAASANSAHDGKPGTVLPVRRAADRLPPQPAARAPTPAKTAELPPGFVPPPGLAPPPGLSPPPGLAPPPPAQAAPRQPRQQGPEEGGRSPSYTAQGFRREVVAILRELAASKNVAAAVQRVRAQRVPRHRQEAEFVDILTRVVEERRGPARRTSAAFAAGVARAFDKEECAAGVGTFFAEVYEDLQAEIPNLSKIVATELLPTLRSVFSSEELDAKLPEGLRASSGGL
mmetsp:Transcript_90280/g.264096  ORF Transcript_90280/g.264096 Transcript_90280/m.264096 type:complete len:394 (-) Transcript_90280:55-1236(-)